MKVHSGASGRERMLVRFDLSSIPSGASVAEASLCLFAWYRKPTASVMTRAYAIRRHWDEGEATWNKASSSVNWTVPGCGDPDHDYDPATETRATLGYTNQHYVWDVTRTVQQWVVDPLSNHGVLVTATDFNTEYQFRTSEISVHDARPCLVVTYRVPTPTSTLTQTPTPTESSTATMTPTAAASRTPTETPCLSPTATPTVTATPAPVQVVFQQGIHPTQGYSGVADTYLTAYQPSTARGGQSDLVVDARGNGVSRALIRFHLKDCIPSNAHVVSARLSLWAWSRRTLAGVRVWAFDVTREWDANAATWNRASASELWGLPGCSQVGTDRDGSPVSSLYVYVVAQSCEWDVRSIVQRWVSEPSANKGLLLVSVDTEQQIRLRSSEWLVATQRPRLTVVYSMTGHSSSEGELPSTLRPTKRPTRWLDTITLY